MGLKSWLQEQAIVQERLLSSMETSKQDPGNHGKSHEVSQKKDPK